MEGQVLTGLVALCVLGACNDRPSDAELERLRAEAVAANQAAIAAAPSAEGPGYTLTVSGQIAKPGATLDWAALQRTGMTVVETLNVQNPDRKTPTKFRGLLLRDVLDQYGAKPEATEATVVAVDGFRATVQIADARQYRMLLALEADGAPIPRSSGGPIFLVFPFSENGPDFAAKYPDRFWSFYVTHVVIGTEEPRLAVIAGDRRVTLERASLERAATAPYDGPVSWKVEWPSGAVHLRGVAIADAFAAAGIPIPAGASIIVRGKAPLHRDPAKPIVLRAADLDRCRPMLAMYWGLDEQPITARQGGPLAVAMLPCGDAYGDRSWVTFVEELEVVAP